MTDLERLYQIIERQQISNVIDITYSFFGVVQCKGDKYTTLDFITDEQIKTVRKLILRGRKAGRIRKRGNGRWTQYEIIKE